MISKSNNTQVPTAAINILPNTHTIINMASNGGANNLTNNSKMGSRRIFTPHFKLQVLESYRKDSDCKGNQRATARKYNIHRRQIQKWLQCESNLRSSVASINHSGLKHQFHNVSQQQQQQVPIMIPTNSNSQFGYHHFESKSQQLPLDTARHSVATNSTTVPSIPVVVPSTNASTQGVYAAANLAAVVAAAAAAGAIAIASTSTTNTSSPLCQTVVSGNTAGISSPILHTHHLQPHHHHHHHHYDTPYTHTSSNMSIPMPVLTHISPQHHRHYPYNLPPHTHTLLQPQSRVSTIPSLMSSTCLPVTVLSSTDLASSSAPQPNITPEEVLYKRSEGNNSIEFNEHETKIVVDNVEDCCIRKSLNKYSHSTCIENGYQKEYALQSYNATQESSNTPCLTVTPIDLSIGSRRENAENINCSLRHLPSADDVAENKNENVVDLTFRKRKVILRNDQTHKHMRNSENDSKTLFTKVKECNESDDDDIEVEMEIKSAPPKPVKLFKPYLLDEKDEKFYEHDSKPTSGKKVFNENESRLYSLYKVASDGKPNNFNLSNVPEHNFQVESTYFQGCKPLNLPSAFHMTAISALSPVIPCAEGSPVSGYESSSSTYSESSYREKYYRRNVERTCNIDLQVHAVCENLTYQENCVGKWFNHDTNSNPPATNASIVLYA
ncbi:uncharacterized protein LOC105219434 [Zeugodacus cucurbitae]|uniref:Brinker DNA-binding domain-containing protein n=1 Tax=Zeugodacus cucurbitae TaxID=28588 RepID=A0A0A1WVA4_ZEUCU|nr:uncharacterized protein LOC105219434 [Zeugodacus cucurbitae]